MTESERNIRTHVQELAATIGERNVFRPAALCAAGDYIEAVWRRQGRRMSRQEYEINGARCANLEVTQPGTRQSNEILVVGAHYDTVRGSPGANDNASGVAALLEIARLFARTSPVTTVRFVAFANEELPFFRTARQGSLVYARAARARGDNIKPMVSLETMGCYSDAPGSQRYPPLLRHFYPNRGNFLALVSDFRSLPVTRYMARVFRHNTDFPLEYAGLFRWIPGVAWSDHRSFWHCGYRALMATDTAFLRYPYYHSPEDTPDKLNIPKLAQATVALFQCFSAVATAVD